MKNRILIGIFLLASAGMLGAMEPNEVPFELTEQEKEWLQCLNIDDQAVEQLQPLAQVDPVDQFNETYVQESNSKTPLDRNIYSNQSTIVTTPSLSFFEQNQQAQQRPRKKRRVESSEASDNSAHPQFEGDICCGLCGDEVYKNWNYVFIHLRGKQHKVSTSPGYCDHSMMCNEYFVTNSDRLRHMAEHTSRDWHCPDCDKGGCKDYDAVRSHYGRTKDENHTGFFHCKAEGCGAKFLRYPDRSWHILEVHLGMIKSKPQV